MPKKGRPKPPKPKVNKVKSKSQLAPSYVIGQGRAKTRKRLTGKKN